MKRLNKYIKGILVGVILSIIPNVVYAEDYNTLVNNCTKVSKNYNLNIDTIISKKRIETSSSKATIDWQSDICSTFDSVVLKRTNHGSDITIELLKKSNIVLTSRFTKASAYNAFYKALIKETIIYLDKQSLLKDCIYDEYTVDSKLVYKTNILLSKEYSIDKFLNASIFFNNDSNYKICLDDIAIPTKYIDNYKGRMYIKYTIYSQDKKSFTYIQPLAVINIKSDSIKLPLVINCLPDTNSIKVELYKPIAETEFKNIQSSNLEKISSTTVNFSKNKSTLHSYTKLFIQVSLILFGCVVVALIIKIKSEETFF